jgi:hypothetical protein
MVIFFSAVIITYLFDRLAKNTIGKTAQVK